MPTYDYRCRDCGHTVEVIHSMSEEGPSACDVCGGPLRRVLFASGIIFKGSGFYRNDSRRDAASSDRSSKPAPKGGEGSPPSASAPGDASSGSPAPSGDSGSTSGTTRAGPSAKPE